MRRHLFGIGTCYTKVTVQNVPILQCALVAVIPSCRVAYPRLHHEASSLSAVCCNPHSDDGRLPTRSRLEVILAAFYTYIDTHRTAYFNTCMMQLLVVMLGVRNPLG